MESVVLLIQKTEKLWEHILAAARCGNCSAYDDTAECLLGVVTVIVVVRLSPNINTTIVSTYFVLLSSK